MFEVKVVGANRVKKNVQRCKRDPLRAPKNTGNSNSKACFYAD
jgi:hypothetical protein